MDIRPLLFGLEDLNCSWTIQRRLRKRCSNYTAQ